VEPSRCLVVTLLARNCRRGVWELRRYVRVSLEDGEFLAGLSGLEESRLLRM